MVTTCPIDNPFQWLMAFIACKWIHGHRILVCGHCLGESRGNLTAARDLQVCGKTKMKRSGQIPRIPDHPSNAFLWILRSILTLQVILVLIWIQMSCSILNYPVPPSYDYGKSSEANYASSSAGFVGKYAQQRSMLDYAYHSMYSECRQLLHDQLIERFLATKVVDHLRDVVCEVPLGKCLDPVVLSSSASRFETEGSHPAATLPPWSCTRRPPRHQRGQGVCLCGLGLGFACMVAGSRVGTHSRDGWAGSAHPRLMRHP